eukprot:COSAG02_NODE_1692_length_11293_cov_12.853940_4_plen_893_part_00
MDLVDGKAPSDREMYEAVVDEIAPDDIFCGGPGAEALVWLDTSCTAASWRAGDFVLVESATVPLMRQVARVERRVAHSKGRRTAAQSVDEVSGVCISRLLALTVGARIGTVVRVSVAAVHRAGISPAKQADAVQFMAGIDLQENNSVLPQAGELAAAVHTSREMSSRTALFHSPGMSDFLAVMLKGSVIIPGQTLAVDWLNKPQLVVAVAVSACGRNHAVGSADCVQTTAAIVGDATKVSFEHVDSIVRGGMNISGIEAWVQLPHSVPPKLGEWQSRVLRKVGGLQGQVHRLLNRLHAVLADPPDDARARQSRQGHCVFVHGESGCGKTHLIESALCCAPGVTICRLDGGQVLQPTLEESVVRVITTFRAARRQQPSVVIIEELDALGGMDGAGSLSIGNGSGPVGVAQARVIARLNHEIDRLANGPACAVAVIGTSSRPENVATTLRRAGRFEVEIEIPPLLPLQRKEILQLLTSQFRIGTVRRLGSGPLFSLIHEGQDAVAGEQTGHQDDLIARLADLAVGYVAADLANLTREAALRAMAEIPKAENRERSSCSVANADTAIAVAWEHLEAALVATRPSSLQRLQRGGAAGSSCVSNGTSRHDFQSLESLAATVSSEVVRQLKTAILLPLSGAGRAAFQTTNLRPSRGALLYGPAGNGKTLLAAAVGRSYTAADHAAADSSFNWIEVHAAELISAVSGESEKNVSAMFARARSAAPSILFIDELEVLTPSRGRGDGPSSSLNTLERVLSVFLTQLDGVVDTGATAAAASAPVVIIGATRDISAVDPAILRSGRIDTHIHIGPPDARARAAIIRLRCSQMGATMDALDPAQIERLVEVTDGFSRADIDSLCRESAMQALREDIEARQVGPKHFQTALLRQRPVQIASGLAR